MFVSLLFWGMVMFANEVEPKEKWKLPEMETAANTGILY